MKDEKGELVDLLTRTKAFALRVIRLFAALPRTIEAQMLGKQMLRSGTSVGAHYREGGRARSSAEFISKIEGAIAELDETSYWLELIADSGIMPASRLSPLRQEADELMAIFVTCVKNAKNKRTNELKSNRAAK